MRNKHYFTWKFGKPTNTEALRFYSVFGERWLEWYRFVCFVLHRPVRLKNS